MLVQAICDKVRERGYRRVILLGPEDTQAYGQLKGRLVHASIMVLAPGSADRAWIAACMGDPEGMEADTLDRLKVLLTDGIEHGVDGIIVSDDAWADTIRLVVADVPVLSATQQEGEDA